MNSDGSYSCDRCGTDVVNGGVIYCAVVSDLIEVNGATTVINYHFCRDREEGGKKVQGCASKVLSKRNLQHYHETKESKNAGGSEK